VSDAVLSAVIQGDLRWDGLRAEDFFGSKFVNAYMILEKLKYGTVV
jgi:hypothetical protein